MLLSPCYLTLTHYPLHTRRLSCFTRSVTLTLATPHRARRSRVRRLPVPPAASTPACRAHPSLQHHTTASFCRFGCRATLRTPRSHIARGIGCTCLTVLFDAFYSPLPPPSFLSGRSVAGNACTRPFKRMGPQCDRPEDQPGRSSPDRISAFNFGECPRLGGCTVRSATSFPDGLLSFARNWALLYPNAPGIIPCCYSVPLGSRGGSCRWMAMSTLR